ncbi:MAG: ThiF family adenylyltransferase [Bacteroidetes bacterium]|nr:MAG: ThiF family adenylyltransferase [Bacteroidota bacterium]
MDHTTSRKKIKLDPRAKSTIKDYYEGISWWKVDDVAKARVMVVGAGALGNEALKNLALLNVGHILIVDFDTVEYSNLARSVLYREADCEARRFKVEIAAERIREINPAVKVMTINGDIMIDVGLGIFRRMDVVIGCLDNRLARLYINRHCYKVQKTWVDGAIENLSGQMNVYKPGRTCYECELTDTGWQNIRSKIGCPDIARRNALKGRIPTTPISSSIIAAMQVQEALKVVWNNEEQSMAGQKFYYDGMNNFMMQFEAPGLKELCDSHFTYEPIEEAPELSAQMSVEEVLNFLADRYGHPTPAIELDYEVVLGIETAESGKAHEVLIPKPHFSDKIAQQYQQVPGEEIGFSREVSLIDGHFEHPQVNLVTLGIPPLHILRVRVGEELHFVELTGDAPYLNFQ